MGSAEQKTGVTHADTDIVEGRRKVWAVFLLPLAVTGIFFAVGASRYAAMPDVIPTHWGPDGTPDAYSDKSFWSVFGPLLIGPGAAIFFAFIAFATSALVPESPTPTRWRSYQREGSYRANVLLLGLVATLIALLIGTVCVAAWNGVSSFAPWPVAVFVVVVLGIILVGYPAGQRWARRRAREAGVEPSPAEIAEDEKWVAGGLYRDADDPRVLVPKREGQGVGTTLNIGSAAGKAVAAALLVLVLAVPFGLTIAALFN